MSKPDGGQAFPEPGVFDGNRDQVNPVGAYYDAGGMSLRDYFAAKALPAVYVEFCNSTRAGECDVPGDWRRGLAADAYMLADAMIAERAKP